MNTEMVKSRTFCGGTGCTNPSAAETGVLGKYLGIAALAACGVIFIIGLIDGMPVMEIFMTAVSLASPQSRKGLPLL
jgi:Ca2+-transporting ATPase